MSVMVQRRVARRRVLLLVALFAGVTGCERSPSPSPAADAAPADLRAAAAKHYEAYGAALAAARRGAIPAFYHRDGALIVFNGVAERSTQAQLKRLYEGEWSPPAYFAWEDLTYDPVSTTHVLVNGGFRWQAAGERDTVRYVYAAMLAAADSGMGIIFEHETLRPKP